MTGTPDNTFIAISVNPIQVVVPREIFWDQKDHIVNWCTQNIGPYNLDWSNPEFWSYHTIFGAGIFYFKNSQDALMFSLRWIK